MITLRTTEIKLIGAFFLVAGLFGFFTFATLIFPLNNPINILNIFPAFLFGLTLYSGYLLLLKENPKGLEIARAVVALQIIHFNIAGIGYLFVTGVYVFIGFSNLDFAINFGLDNTFHITVFTETDKVIFRMNILALGAFIYLTRVNNKLSEDEKT